MEMQWMPIIWATLATLCYGVYLHAPRRVLISIALVGGMGYLIYSLVEIISCDAVFSTFIAASTVGYLSEVLARKMKCPAIVWVIPGILPLAPGYGLYKTMEYFINGQYISALERGLLTFMIAGAISLGVLGVTTVYRAISNTGSSKMKRVQECEEKEYEEVE